MIRKIFKWVGLMCVMIVLSAVVYLSVNGEHTKSFPHIISSFYAKEFCSCYFVTEGSEPECHQFAKQWIPISEFHLDKENQTVSVTGLFVTTRARYTGDRYGCVLDKPINTP